MFCCPATTTIVLAVALALVPLLLNWAEEMGEMMQGHYHELLSDIWTIEPDLINAPTREEMLWRWLRLPETVLNRITQLETTHRQRRRRFTRAIHRLTRKRLDWNGRESVVGNLNRINKENELCYDIWGYSKQVMINKFFKHYPGEQGRKDLDEFFNLDTIPGVDGRPCTVRLHVLGLWEEGYYPIDSEFHQNGQHPNPQLDSDGNHEYDWDSDGADLVPEAGY